MSKQTLTTIIIILVALTAGFFSYVYYQSRQSGQAGGIVEVIKNIFPSGDIVPVITPPPDPSTTGGETGGETTGGELPVAAIPRLRHISTLHIAGLIPVERERLLTNQPIIENTPSGAQTKPSTEVVTAVRYVEQETGHVLESFVDRNDERKVSNTTIPRIYEAFFGDKGDSVIFRYLNDDDRTIESFTGSLPPTTLGGDELPEFKGSLLPQNIPWLSISPDTTHFFYLLNFNSGIIGTTALINGEKKSQIFNSEFTEWLPQWVNLKTIALTTKPSASAPGFLYSLDTGTRAFTRVLGNISGLTTLVSPDGKQVLYSVSSNNDINLRLYDVGSRTVETVSLKTLPEKCVWAKNNINIYCGVPNFLPNAPYPDDWYQGTISFSDALWKIDSSSGNTTIVTSPEFELGGASIDIVSPMLSAKENYIFFLNKKDQSLWSYALE
ncbi:MAG: hypothetical protein WC795_02115 [Candidatus Paceibacterota bacterium]|jgi:hypothetical protein